MMITSAGGYTPGARSRPGGSWPHLAVHARMQKGRPHSCEVEGCSYSTTQRSKLVVHARTHTGERPFSCKVEGCGYSAATRSSLTRHVISAHSKKA